MTTCLLSAAVARKAASWLLAVSSAALLAQRDVTAHIAPVADASHRDSPRHPALFWLEPLSANTGPLPAWPQPLPFRLVQKNKMFTPHVLVVPVGASVNFPNADPFFHNVFSLFDGKRFDLGLYEAGKSRDVRFERKGISYIFCNIHPEMSAVVIALDTPWWTMGSGDGSLRVSNVPPGTYEVHLWIEGEDEHTLTRWTHRVVVRRENLDAGTFLAPPRVPGSHPESHLDKFGRNYKSDAAKY